MFSFVHSKRGKIPFQVCKRTQLLRLLLATSALMDTAFRNGTRNVNIIQKGA